MFANFSSDLAVILGLRQAFLLALTGGRAKWIRWTRESMAIGFGGKIGVSRTRRGKAFKVRIMIVM